MALRTGHGGGVKLVGVVMFPVSTWQGDWTARDAEVTQSDSGGCTLYFPVVQDNSWSYECNRDDANFPEVAGWAQGTILGTAYFKLGGDKTNDLSRGDKLTNTLVTAVKPVCDNTNAVVRVTVIGKGGFLTANQIIT